MSNEVAPSEGPVTPEPPKESRFVRAAKRLRTLPWRRIVQAGAAGGALLGIVLLQPVTGIEPGELGVRTNRLTGSVRELGEGWALDIPGIHRIRRFPLRDQVYRPVQGMTAGGAAPYQSIEGLSIGVDVTVRYAFDLGKVRLAARTLPEDVGHGLIEPLVDGVLHEVFAQHTVREIFSTKRAEIQAEIETALKEKLAGEGVALKSVFLGNVDLPGEYRSGLEALLSEELSVEKMRYTLDKHEQEVRDAALVAEAEKVRREKQAEAAGQEEIIAAKARAEAMKHVLPFKEKEIEQRRLEAEAAKITRLKQAEGEAEARRIESGGEADSRRKLAEAEAYRVEITGKAASEQLARDASLISANPLLIQKTIADKLSDKISVIVAPPQAASFLTASFTGQLPMRANTAVANTDREPADDGAGAGE